MSDDELDECPICFEIVRNRWFTPCCDYIIHENCYKRCVEEQPACPMCRAVTIVIHEVEIAHNHSILKRVTVFATSMMLISIAFNLLCLTNSSKGDE